MKLAHSEFRDKLDPIELLGRIGELSAANGFIFVPEQSLKLLQDSNGLNLAANGDV